MNRMYEQNDENTLPYRILQEDRWMFPDRKLIDELENNAGG